MAEQKDTLTTPEPPCPREATHTVHPCGYVAYSYWADQMMLTHEQRVCPGCGLLAIWVPQPGIANLTRPAVDAGNCSWCGAWFDADALIRTDDQGGWVGECCMAGDADG